MAENNNKKADSGDNKSGDTPTPAPPQKKLVQLKSNQAGHHAGETFTEGRAKALGILDHCAPFKK